MYTYTQYAYRNGSLANQRVNTLSKEDLEIMLPHGMKDEYGIIRDYDMAFLKLINHWNKVGLLGVAESNIVYVYVVEDGEK